MQIYVGPKRKAYGIHRILLASYSNFFAQKVISPGASIGIPGGTDEIFLEKHDPITFEIFITWLYRSTIHDLEKVDDAVAMEQVRHLVDLYITAEEWDIKDLKNLILDRP